VSRDGFRQTTGLGSVLHHNEVMLTHVSYWLTEHRDGRMITTSGHIRGDARVLTRLALAHAELVLVLDDDQRLAFRLTRHGEDPMTWEIEALGSPGPLR